MAHAYAAHDRRAGSTAEPEGKSGVAEVTAALLTRGTTTRSAEEIADAIGFVGGQLDAAASSEGVGITTVVLTESLDTGLALLADVVLRPTFPEAELERLRTRMLSTLELQLSQPDALVERRFQQEIFGAHPYGRVMTPTAVRSLTRADVAQFHKNHYRPRTRSSS
ncbi:MAG: M16 family metallopeptidase [Gemmatimonadaceae bacterium]